MSAIQRDPGQPAPRGAPVRAAGGAREARQPHRGRRTTRPPTTGWPSGRSRPSGSTGTRSGTRSWTGTTRPFAKWFVGGKLNAAYNCVDRHVEDGDGDKVAFHWVGEPEDDTRDITYAELKDEVCQAANALTELGVEKGDRVAIYMPMIPETVIAMLACARIGAPHTVVFGGFSSDALASRVEDCEREGGHHRRRRLPARRPVGAQAGRRRGRRQGGQREGRRRRARCWWSVVPGRTSSGTTSRDVWWHDVVDGASTEHERRVVRRRAPALRHVHLRHDRQAQGHPAHDRRLPRRLRRTRTGRSSTSSPRPTSTGAPPTSAG